MRALDLPTIESMSPLSKRRIRIAIVTAAAGVVLAPSGTTPAAAVTSAAYLPGTSCPAFPADNWWHANVASLPLQPLGAQWLAHMRAAPGSTTRLHPDFGPSYGAQPVPYGIPITIVPGTHPKVAVTFTYAAESDNVRYPLGADTAIEGGPTAGGDRHAIVVRTDTCRVFETFDTRQGAGGAWSAGSGAVWSLKGNTLRPAGWTSADAAGLPILAGLLRYDEVLRGDVDHAVRFTTDVTDRSYLWPARHQAGSVSDSTYPPMGARFRLKASYSLSGLRPDTQVVLRAMARHGLVLADNGSPWFFQGTSDAAWPSALLDELKTVPASAFEAVDTSSLMVSPDSAQAKPS